jgi:hypothetical protein
LAQSFSCATSSLAFSLTHRFARPLHSRTIFHAWKGTEPQQMHINMHVAACINRKGNGEKGKSQHTPLFALSMSCSTGTPFLFFVCFVVSLLSSGHQVASSGLVWLGWVGFGSVQSGSGQGCHHHQGQVRSVGSGSGSGSGTGSGSGSSVGRSVGRSSFHLHFDFCQSASQAWSSINLNHHFFLQTFILRVFINNSFLMHYMQTSQT